MKRLKPKGPRRKTDSFPYLMVAPAVLLFLTFVIVPFFTGIYTSLFRWDGFSDMEWNGVRNYGFVLRDSVFWQAMRNTFAYAILVTVFKNVIAFLLASILIRSFRGRTLFRTGLYLPVTMSYIVVGAVWVWIYNPTFGLLNTFLRAVGLEHLIAGWLSDPDVALYSVIAVDVWKWFGYHMVLYMAGLQAIPAELHESADIDGASAWRRLRHVTLPMLNSTIVVNVLMSFAGAFVSNYDIVYIMTDGGPFHSTEVALTYIVTTAFRHAQVGKANAMSVLLFVTVFIFGFFQLKLMSREEHYG